MDIDGQKIQSTEDYLSNEEQSVNYTVDSNVAYSVDIDESGKSWITVISNKAILKLSIAANKTYDSREGKVYLKDNNGKTYVTITLHQGESYELTVSPSEISVSKARQEAVVEVMSNVELEIIIPEDAKSIVADVRKSSSETKGLGKMTYVIDIAANETYDDREARIIFKQVDGPMSCTVAIHQSQTDSLGVVIMNSEGSSHEAIIDGRGGTIELSVTHNIDYKVTPEVEWIHHVQTKALETESLYLTIDANQSDDIRIGQVLIGSSDGSLTDTLTISQYVMDYSRFTIPAADLDVNEYVNKDQGVIINGTPATPLSGNFEETGVFKVWAILREMVANGTQEKFPAEILAEMKRHKPVVYGEHPQRVETVRVYRDRDRRIDVYFDEYCEFLMHDELANSSDYGWDIRSSSHARTTVGAAFVALKPVIDATGIKIGLIGQPGNIDDDAPSYLRERNYIKAHPEILFYRSASIKWGHCGTNRLQNVGVYMESLGNRVEVRQGDWGINTEGWEMDEDGRCWVYFVCKDYETPIANCMNGDLCWTADENDGVVGGDNAGQSGHGFGMSGSLYPTKEHMNDDDVWCETSLWQYGSCDEATSEASPMAMSKFYLSSLMNYAINPSLTVAENRRLIREGCLDHYLYEKGELYGVGKRINPGATIKQYYSNLPESISLEEDALVPITTSVFKGSIIVGPGVVDENGTPVREDNFTQMWGKKLYLSPSYLRKCGYKGGDVVEFVEYLCLDARASGIGGPTSEAFKYIDKHSICYTMSADAKTLVCIKATGSGE